MRFLVVLALSLLCSGAFAADTKNHAAAPAGISLKEIAVGVTDTTWISNGESLSAMFSFTRDWMQTYLGIYKTKGDVDFSIGGAYKFTVAGTRSTGFHVGPGATLGTVGGNFGFAAFVAMGGHFTMLEHLLVSFDIGPMVTHTEDNTNFRMRSLGSLLGTSLFYVF